MKDYKTIQCTNVQGKVNPIVKEAFDNYKTYQMPMQKDFTPVISTQSSHFQEIPEIIETEPSESTLNKIMQYAASYRVEKVSDDEFIDYFLN